MNVELSGATKDDAATIVARNAHVQAAMDGPRGGLLRALPHSGGEMCLVRPETVPFVAQHD